MRKILLLLLFGFSFIQITIAQQMSDEQVMQYVMEAQEKGVSQQKMASELLKRGVTMDQVNRIRAKYDKSSETGFVGKTLTEKDRMRKPLKEGENFQIKSDKTLNKKNEFIPDSPEELEYQRELQMMQGLHFLYPSDSLQYYYPYKKKKEKEIFGRNIFSNKNLTFEPNLSIATPLNYQLGPGDEVIIDIWGASEETYREKISPDGTIQIKNLGPVYLSGLTVKDANSQLQTQFSKIYSGIVGDQPISQIRLTLGEIRTIQINIMGEVKNPGTYSLSSFASVFHALYQAGGVSDIGSLRNVKVYRENKLLATLDIYQYILDGKMDGDVRLRDDDGVIVDPYECFVNLVGKVKRPMFYEMKKEESVGTLLKYAGGFAGDAYTKNIRLIRKSGREHQIFSIDEFDVNTFNVLDGDSLTVDSVLIRFANRVEIRGAVYRPGMYQMDGRITTIKELIYASEGIRGDAFVNRGVLHRENDDLTLEAHAIDIKGLIEGSIPDMPLRRNDILFIPSIHDIQEDRTVTIYGEVAYPGIYQFAKNSTLEDIILQAGGLLEAASTVRIDVSRRIKKPKATSTDDIIAKVYNFSLKDGFVVDGEVGFTLEPFDELYVRKSPGYQQQQNVKIEGEILFDGTYALTRKNQRLSELITTAGGLTPEAYARGARLERKMTPEEKLRMQTLLRMAEKGSGQDSISAKSLDLGDTYFVGIELDKALSDPGTDADIVLREGDRIIVPQFISTVKINGAVMHPNTVTYQNDKKMSYYIDMAGGYSQKAKKSSAYVIYMNGTVARLKSGNKKAIQPGCEIIVPTKQPRRGLSTAEIFSMGTSAATLATMVTTMVNQFK